MLIRVAGIGLALACIVSQGTARSNDNTKPAETRGENESVVITATVYAKPEAVKEVLGSDLGGHYIVVAVEVTPRFGKEVAINRDDFILKTDKDGETQRSVRAQPDRRARRHGRPPDRRHRVPPACTTTTGPSGAAIQALSGSRAGLAAMAWATPARQKAPRPKTRTGSHEKEDPMLAVLKDKELPETKTDKPVSGLLYFPMEKQKVKDLELRYNPSEDKITMRFRQEK